MDLESWEIKKIINVANELQKHGSTGASTKEHIAAVFVLNQMDLLPANHGDVVKAWDLLDHNWQQYVKIIKQNHMDLIK